MPPATRHLLPTTHCSLQFRWACRPRSLLATCHLPPATYYLRLTAHIHICIHICIQFAFTFTFTYAFTFAVAFTFTFAFPTGVQEGDIVNVDVSPILDGVHSDLNETFCVGNVNAQKKNLIKATPTRLGLGFPL